MSKGSNARPFSISHDKFAEQFDSIFRSKTAPAGCAHEVTIANPEDDVAITRCVECSAAVPWLKQRIGLCTCEPRECREAEARNCRDWTKRNVEDGK